MLDVFDEIMPDAANYYRMAKEGYEYWKFGQRIYNRDVPDRETRGILFIYLVFALMILLFLFLLMAWWCKKDGRRIF